MKTRTRHINKLLSANTKPENHEFTMNELEAHQLKKLAKISDGLIKLDPMVNQIKAELAETLNELGKPDPSHLQDEQRSCCKVI